MPQDRLMQQADRFMRLVIGNEAAFMRGRRRAALQRFAELGLPSRKEEGWRYTSIEALLEMDFLPLAQTTPTPAKERIEPLFLDAPLAGRVVMVDGVFRPELSAIPRPGIEIQSLRTAVANGDREVLEALGSLSGSGTHAFEALNLATLLDGVVVRVKAGCAESRPLELLHLTSGAAAGHRLNVRHLLLMAESARLSLIERFLPLDDGACFTNQVLEILLGKGAGLSHQRVQMEGEKSFHLAELHVRPEADSRYEGIHVALGAVWSRIALHLSFTQARAACDLHGLYLTGEGQLTDYHLEIDHAVPGCSSRENFKGILSGNGCAVFDGSVMVRPGAQQSDAHLSNANLMLSRAAEVDTKPQLEIYADDVKCSHGATVGQLDDDAVFYLRSRGLDEATARSMLSLAFANEILQQLPTKTLRERLAGEVARRLEK